MGEVVSYTKAGIDALIADAIANTDGVTQADLDAAMALIINEAPETLDTLGELANKLGEAMGVVIHGATAGTARPAGFGAIHWIGSVAPTNAIDNDVWTDTSA